MATNCLTTSSEGISKLTLREASIDGLYNDVSGYATYGVGHLVHPTDKFESLLLRSAQTAKLCESRIKKQWPATPYETSYLEREVVTCAEYEQLKINAKESAQDVIAQKKFKKNFVDLSEAQKAVAENSANDALNRETQLLSTPTKNIFAQDLKPYEKAVNDGVTGVMLLQEEFDALVSFTFNIGTTAFAASSILKKINENKYRSGTAAERGKAIQALEGAFLAWNKSGGKEIDGLTKRRQSEADQFLGKAREEFKALQAADKKGALLQPSSKKPLSELAMRAVRGVRPTVPA